MGAIYTSPNHLTLPATVGIANGRTNGRTNGRANGRANGRCQRPLHDSLLTHDLLPLHHKTQLKSVTNDRISRNSSHKVASLKGVLR